MSILNTDSYKLGHPEQYPDMRSAIAYAECRRGGWPNPDDDRIVLYGLRYHIEKYLNRRVTNLDVEEAADLMSTYGPGQTTHPFPLDLMKQIVAEGGYFPVRIEALPEGSVIYPHTPVYQIYAEEKYSRLITYLETCLSRLW